MKMDEYVDSILTSLGHPIVKIEIQEWIPDLVNRAFKEIRRVITDNKLMTVPYAKHIDLSDKKVSAVTRVLRGDNIGSIIDTIDPMYSLISTGSSVSLNVDGYVNYALTQRIKNTVSTDLDFIFEDHNLYVTANYPYPQAITLMYIPTYDTVEEVTEDHWCQLILRLALAYCKEMLGRVRGKYKLNSANYELDADQLLSEAAQEISDIRTYIDDNSDIILPLD